MSCTYTQTTAQPTMNMETSPEMELPDKSSKLGKDRKIEENDERKNVLV